MEFDWTTCLSNMLIIITRNAIIVVLLSWFSSIPFPLSSFGQSDMANEVVSNGLLSPGTLMIEVSGRGKQGDHIWKYQLQPQFGSVRMVSDELAKTDSRTYEDPPSSVESKRCGMDLVELLNSPDGMYSAKCIPSNGEWIWGNMVQVTDIKTSHTLYQWKVKGRIVRHFAWGGNSRSLVILNISEHSSVDPVGVFSALSGHPIPHDTIFVDIVDITTGKIVEYLIRKNVLYGEARIVGWTE